MATFPYTQQLDTLQSGDTRELGQQVPEGQGEQLIFLPPTLSLSVSNRTAQSPYRSSELNNREYKFPAKLRVLLKANLIETNKLLITDIMKLFRSAGVSS